MGPNGQLIPSIPPDDFAMDHAFWGEAAKEWMNDVDRGGREKNLNPEGYANVLARAMAELEIVNMLAAANQPPPEQAGGPGAPAGEQGQANNDLASPPPSGSPMLGPPEEPAPTPEEVSAMALEGA